MIGHSYLHTAIDDHSRLSCAQILPDERKETATAFWRPATDTSPPLESPSGAS